MANKIKHFLFYHGEKLAFGVIALVCLWSILGDLMRGANVLPLSSGEVFIVDAEQVKHSIKRITRHLADVKAQKSPPAITAVSRLIEEQYREFARKIPAADLQWVTYCQPPKPRAITRVGPPPKAARDPDDHWRTAVASPVDWRVIVGRKRVLVICRTKAEDEGGIRFPLPGSVHVNIWRKRVGEGRETLNDEVRNAFRQRQAEGLEQMVSMNLAVRKPVAKEKPAPAPATPPAENPFREFIPGQDGMEPGGKPARRRPRSQPHKETAPLPWMRGGEEPSPAAALPEAEEGPAPAAERANPVQAFYARLNRWENQVHRHLLQLTDTAGMEATKWESRGRMRAYGAEDFSELFAGDSIKEILSRGELPKPRAKPGGGKAAPHRGPATPATPGPAPGPGPVPGPAPVPGPVPAPPPVQPGSPGPVPTVGPPPSTTSDELKAKFPAYQRQYFVFLDNDVGENAVYRYRMAAWLKARNLPPQLRVLEEYRDYLLRVENADLTYKVKQGEKENVLGYFAVTASQFKEHLQSEAPVPGIGGQYQPANFKPIRRDPKYGRVLDLLDATNNQTRLGAELAHKPCFSLFTYTDVVLTPLLKRLHPVSISYGKDGVATVRIHVYISTQKGYVRTPVACAVTAPVEAGTLTWRNWVVLGPDRKPLWKGGKPVLRDLAQYYAQVKGLRPVPIGEKQKIRGGKEWDFRTDWGLVDVRRCKLRVYRYRITADGEREPLSKEPVSKDGGPYLVLRSLKKKNLYRRIILKRPKPASTDKVFERVEIIGRPERREWRERKTRSRKETGQKPAVDRKAPAPAR